MDDIYKHNFKPTVQAYMESSIKKSKKTVYRFTLLNLFSIKIIREGLVFFFFSFSYEYCFSQHVFHVAFFLSKVFFDSFFERSHQFLFEPFFHFIFIILSVLGYYCFGYSMSSVLFVHLSDILILSLELVLLSSFAQTAKFKFRVNITARKTTTGRCY